ncbi:MAG: PIN domain-containing protein, partial [Myxococcales bacterium]
PAWTNEMGTFARALDALLEAYGNLDLFRLVTYDAGACSKANAEHTRSRGLHYLLGLKGSQRSTVTMAAESQQEALFLDTSLIIAATVGAHPSHVAAASFIEKAASDGLEFCMSPQFLVVLTRQPVSDRHFSLEEALGALETWTAECRLLEESYAVVEELLSLVQRYQVRGKQVHDCNIVATMRQRHQAFGNPQRSRFQALC